MQVRWRDGQITSSFIFSQMLSAFLTTIFFSFSAVTGNRCAKIFGGVEANFYRLVAATMFLGIYVLFLDKTISGPAATMFTLSGIVGVGCGDLLFFQALPRLGSRMTILLIQCLSVPFAAAVEWWWMDTLLTRKQVLGSGLVLLGICIALHRPGGFQKVSSQLKVGLCLGILAAFGNGIGAVLSRKAYFIASENGMDIGGPSAAFQRVLGGLLVAVIAMAIARWRLVQKQVLVAGWSASAEYKSRWQVAWPWVLGTSLAGQTFGVACFQWALKSQPTGVVLPIVAMTPLVAMPITHIFEGERPTIKSFLGGVIAVAGVLTLVMAL